MDRKSSSNLSGLFLNVFYPFKMLLRVYSLCILLVDIAWVMANTVCAIAQAIYELLRPPPLKSLRLETALVIGSGRGVGKEIAIQLASLGVIVLCVDINKASNDDTVQYIKKKGGSAASYTCDITKKENVDALATQVRKDIGFVSMLFYCCGIPSPRSLVTLPPLDIHVTLDLTLTSYFWLIDHFLPDMKARNHGHIVALTSVAGLSYIRDQMPLSVAQFAVQGLAESLSEDLRVNKIDGVHVTLTHIYPFIVSNESELRLRYGQTASVASLVAVITLQARSRPDVWQQAFLKKMSSDSDVEMLLLLFVLAKKAQINVNEIGISSYFGTITPKQAATSILESVRRNYFEASVPKHLIYLGHLLRILPRNATVLIRDLLDTGVDFA